MKAIAFYAPMKPPDDPVPSGDRTMARNLLAALQGSCIADVTIASRFKSRDGVGDRAMQERILTGAEQEIERLSSWSKPDLWLTYHSYYKAPDLLGPRLSRHWNIPYAIVEGTRARSRLEGPYARFAAAAEAACDTAAVIFSLTQYDREALERDRLGAQRIANLRPFLGDETLPPLTSPSHSDTFRLLACAMFREGDKLASYDALASALKHVRAQKWMLDIIGDGPARGKVEELFSQFGGKVTFSGVLDQEALTQKFREGDLLVWPGIGEAFGMVYLEAQAQGCPVLAEDRPGVRDVVRDGGWLVPTDSPKAYAAMIDILAQDAKARHARGRKGRERVAADHLLPAARATLKAELFPLLRT